MSARGVRRHHHGRVSHHNGAPRRHSLMGFGCQQRGPRGTHCQGERGVTTVQAHSQESRLLPVLPGALHRRAHQRPGGSRVSLYRRYTGTTHTQAEGVQLQLHPAQQRSRACGRVQPAAKPRRMQALMPPNARVGCSMGVPPPLTQRGVSSGISGVQCYQRTELVLSANVPPADVVWRPRSLPSRRQCSRRQPGAARVSVTPAGGS